VLRCTGWCIFNDLAVAAKAAQRDAGVGQVLMLDLDVHQGDGSATIFAGVQMRPGGVYHNLL
jgi:acetoin utilization deacetylase AcuC-like enzyme